jgi:hypothetical protein
MSLKGWKFKTDESKIPTFNCWQCKDTGYYYDYPQKDGWEVCACDGKQPISHCCENNLHFDCSGSVIDDTDGKFNHRGKCFCECHLSRTEKHRFESTDAVDTIPPQVKNSAVSLRG